MCSLTSRLRLPKLGLGSLWRTYLSQLTTLHSVVRDFVGVPPRSDTGTSLSRLLSNLKNRNGTGPGVRTPFKEKIVDNPSILGRRMDDFWGILSDDDGGPETCISTPSFRGGSPPVTNDYSPPVRSCPTWAVSLFWHYTRSNRDTWEKDKVTNEGTKMKFYYL